MELNNNVIEFDIICTDDVVIKEAILEYNKIYKTNFEILKFGYDEVVFAKIRVSEYKISDIFDLGYFFHSHVVLKRQKGEIDW
jgi:hypothetical protein